MSLGEWMQEATPREVRVPVCNDGKLLSRYEDAKARAVKSATTPMLGDDEKLAAMAEVEQLEAEVKAKTRIFVFESIGWGNWRSLVAKHPPRREVAEIFEQAIEAKVLPEGFDEVETDMTTFVPAVLMATCSQISSVEEARGLIETMPTGVVSRIWAGVLKVNHGGQNDPFAEGFIDSETPLASAKK